MAYSSGLLLTALILSFFAAMAVAGRPQPIFQSSAAEGLARALGVTAGTGTTDCCTCLCTSVYPPTCFCGGDFTSCPAFCEDSCIFEDDVYKCNAGLTMAVCGANSCDRLLAASSYAAEGDAAAQVAEK